MRLKILSLKGIEYEGEVAGLNVKTASGEITVLDRHRPLLTTLAPGKAIILKNDGSRETRPIASGFLEMGPANDLTVLAD